MKISSEKSKFRVERFRLEINELMRWIEGTKWRNVSFIVWWSSVNPKRSEIIEKGRNFPREKENKWKDQTLKIFLRAVFRRGEKGKFSQE